MIAKLDTVKAAVLRTEERILQLEDLSNKPEDNVDEWMAARRAFLKMEYSVRDKLYEVYMGSAGGVYV